MCLCMLFACTGLIGCSDSNDEYIPGTKFDGDFRMLSVDTLSLSEGYAPDSTTVKVSIQGTTLMLDIDCIQVYRQHHVQLLGDLIVWSDNNGLMEIRLSGDNISQSTPQYPEDSCWISIKGCIDNFPEWLAKDRPTMDALLYYRPLSGSDDSAESSSNIGMDLSWPWKFDIREGETMTWKIPALSFRNASNSAFLK